MGAALHPGVGRAGASFELERLELADGRLVVRGWWSGLRGVRFVRPALVVNGRQVLATLEHKPWAADGEGVWTAAFPWRAKGKLDVSEVMLVVAPSVEVPLDREAVVVAPAAVVPELRAGAAAVPRTGVEAAPPRLGDELAGLERQLDGMQVELREARALAAEREVRCRELERAVADERRAARDIEAADDDFVRSHAMAVLDRDRALAQHAEAVGDREAAVRARKRMEIQRDEALAARSGAQAGRDHAVAERDDLRRQRDELLLVHQTLQAQLQRGWADADALPAAEPRRSRPARSTRRGDPDAPIGVRVIPAARTVAAHLHRSQREREHHVTAFDLWAARILGSVAALSFIALLLMLLKAFFVF